MNTTKKVVSRIKWDYKENVEIPAAFCRYLWDYDKSAPLEIITKRALQYGNYEEFKKIYELYPEKTSKIAFKYPDTKREVIFWIKRWKNFLD